MTDMSELFIDAHDFNGDIGAWDTSRVTKMNGMFFFDFSHDIGGWAVDSVTDMSSMFVDAASFNSDVSGWAVDSVRDMSDMFYYYQL